MSTINQALEQIKTAGLNSFRCNLTGAPYATIVDSEIIIALKAVQKLDSTISVDRLVDEWELKAVTFNSQTLPSLRGATQKALLSMMDDANGNVKILTYFMTRLFFPHLGAEPLSSETQRERMLFATNLHDTALEWPASEVAAMTQHLAMIDGYLAMPHWHTLWLFESAFSKVGLEAAPAKIKACFATPSVMIDNRELIESVVKFMYQLMLHCAERDGANGKSGNRLAQEIMFLQAAVTPAIVIPHFQKEVSQADRANMERKRMIDNNKPLRVAHSAINGKNHLPGQSMAEAMKRTAELRANMAAKKAASTDSKPKVKKASGVDPKLRAAFEKLMANKN